MKLFSNQGKHLSASKQAQKTEPPKKQPVSSDNLLSKEEIKKLFDTPDEIILPAAESPVSIAEEPPVPVEQEPIAPIEDEQIAPIAEEQPVPAAPVIFEESTIVIDSIPKETFPNADVPVESIEQVFDTEPPALSETITGKKQTLTYIGYGAIVIVLLALLCGITAFFVNALMDTLELQKNLLESDTVTISTTPVPTDVPTDAVQPVTPTPDAAATPEPTPEVPLTVLEKYAEDAEKNPDMFGWIQIEGTKIDYPVMHTPDDPEKYLYKSFNGWPTASGSLFIDAKCSSDSDNLIIYGHNIKNGTMFNSILKYENIDYFNEHPVVKFDTIYQEQEYEVMSAFYDRVYYKSETDVFKFYQFIDAEDEAHFNSAVQTLKDKSIYDTGITAEYGDQLIMLVTCAYHTENGRFVVVARKAA